jgi:hypothetical protein
VIEPGTRRSHCTGMARIIGSLFIVLHDAIQRAAHREKLI